MKKVILQVWLTFFAGLFFSSLYGQSDVRWLEGCDTLTSTPIQIQQSELTDDCCWEMQNGQAIKRSNCDNVIFGKCPPKDPRCKKSKNLYSLVDNTGTVFSNENTLRVYFTDGTFYDVIQPPQTNPQGYTKQLQSWDNLISGLLDNKCSEKYAVETRFNPAPYTLTNLSNYTPPDGLLVPSSELWGLVSKMQSRYLNITSCSSCPAINKIELVAVNGVAQTPKLMTFQFEEGQEKRYDFCQDCGKEGALYFQNSAELVPLADYPVCLFECSESFPPIPESGCDFTLRYDLCDNRGTTDLNDDIPIIVRYADCGDGAIVSDIFVEDNGTVIDYTNLQSFDHITICGTNEIVPPPSNEILPIDCEKEIICVDGKETAWQVKTISNDGVIEITYEDESGIINEPTSWEVGNCKCETFEYFPFDMGSITGTLRNREWHDTEPVAPLTGGTDAGREFRLNHDFSLPTTTDNNQTTFIIDDTNNTASELDIQVIEGYITVTEQINARYSNSSEGYWAVELGQCCSSELTLLNENGGFFSGREMRFTLPVGTHYIRIWNIDSGGSNSSATFGYTNNNGLTWVNTNSPPNVTLSETKPIQECLTGYLCGGVYYENDKTTIVNYTQEIAKPIICIAANNDARRDELLQEILDKPDPVITTTPETCDCVGDNEVAYINGTTSFTLVGGTFCSYSFTVVRGEATLRENNILSPFTLPRGFTEGDDFKDACNFLQNTVTITGANATADIVISYIR